LNDHRAGASGGTRLAHRLAASNTPGPYAERLQDLAESISTDAATLDAVREAWGVDGGAIKRLGAIIMERVGRLKPSGHLLGYSPLSRVLEIEALMSGVQAKRQLWRSMRSLTTTHPALAEFDFALLEIRGDEQLATLEELHVWAVSQVGG
jgi:hypothetical protein